MVIQHNLSSYNSNRILTGNSRNSKKSSERLSSGYRINRAADDAAGLQISEKMRSQVRGLDRASDNIESGISLIQTADGAMNEMHSILNRMTEISVQASNDTNTYDDRLILQGEIDQLTDEINSITEKTEFNGMKILQGNETETPIFGIDGGLPDILKGISDGGTADSTSLGSLSTTYTITNTSGVDEIHSAFYLDFSGVNASNAVDLLGQGFYTTCCTCDNRYSIKFVDTGDKVSSDYSNYIYDVDINGVTSGDDVMNRILNCLKSGGNTTTYTDTLSNSPLTVVEPQNHFTAFGAELDASGNRTGRLIIFDNRADITPAPSSGMGLFDGGIYTSTGVQVTGKEKITIQAGANAGELIEISLPCTWATSMGLSGGLSVMNGASATNAISRISEARNYVSGERSRMGAMQNRLEFAKDNTDNMSEQTQSAESRIRDVDMSKEYMEYMKANLLSQTAQAMLAQANHSPQSVLALLK